MADLRFELVTPERLIRSDEVFMSSPPAQTAISEYSRATRDTPEKIAVEGGFVQVRERGLTVLTERADVPA